MKDELRTNLLPLYKGMFQNINNSKDLYPFCMQWGSQFPQEPNEGILFIGKATNGWVSPTREIDEIFGEGEGRIFARDDQMDWIHRLEGNNTIYNTKKSAFWRVIKKIAQLEYGKEDWYSKIAWSNLYKVSFKKGNPSGKLRKQQENFCIRILEAELEILKPKYVIFLTSGWEKNFIKNLSPNKSKKWGKNKDYETIGYMEGGTILITSHHPQGKKEYEHVMAIKEIMSKIEV